MATVTTDTSGFDRQMRLVEQRTPAAAAGMVMQIGHTAAVAMFKASPRDTNRFARGWAVANNAAGLPGIPVPPVVKSQYQELYRRRLVNQAARVSRLQQDLVRLIRSTEATLKAWYDSKGRKRDPFARDLEAKLRSYHRRLDKLDAVQDRATEELRQLTEGAVFIGGRARKSGKDLGLSNLARAVSRVYGGSGRVYRAGDVWLCEIRNLEPHASIVDRKRGVVRAGREAVKGLSGRTLGQAAVRKLVA